MIVKLREINQDMASRHARAVVVGKVQQKAGEVTGNKTQQAKGAAKQVEGKLWKKTGTLEQALDKIDRKTR